MTRNRLIVVYDIVVVSSMQSSEHRENDKFRSNRIAFWRKFLTETQVIQTLSKSILQN